MTKCPKCGFENADAVGTPTESCPKCGVVYSKVSAAATAPSPAAATRASQAPAAQGREVRISLSTLIACGACLLVGFLAGREQMRYQVATALVSTFGGLAEHQPQISAPSIAAPPPPSAAAEAPSAKPVASPEPSPPAAVAPPPITATLVSKSFRNQDFSGSSYIKAAITFSVRFQNDADKDIRAFDGVLSFNDLLGNKILASNLTISDPIGAGKSLNWNGELEYNQFKSEHGRLRGYSANDLKVIFVPHKILFADGSEKLVQQ